jgi:hypothetical protein
VVHGYQGVATVGEIAGLGFGVGVEAGAANAVPADDVAHERDEVYPAVAEEDGRGDHHQAGHLLGFGGAQLHPQQPAHREAYDHYFAPVAL